MFLTTIEHSRLTTESSPRTTSMSRESCLRQRVIGLLPVMSTLASFSAHSNLVGDRRSMTYAPTMQEELTAIVTSSIEATFETNSMIEIFYLNSSDIPCNWLSCCLRSCFCRLRHSSKIALYYLRHLSLTVFAPLIC